MANEIKISAITGLSITVQLYSGSSTVGSSFSATEIGSTGEYLASVPNATPLGVYLVLATSGGEKIGSDLLYWDGSKEVTPMLLDELHKVRGLDALNPSVITTSSIVSGDIEIAITGDGINTSTFTRQ